ncbi:hypothetical protein A0H81_03069 [Grifola frondosa]|uniref:Velvet domain-containing protein n=1 Tax=Grifola frondosa TaxID=5627 RepID=A0A1C7MHP5_GRIFR|nr:hypothetical protein A0H81_03069 [Grifola frondosa]
MRNTQARRIGSPSIGGPITFVSGQFAGHTLRAELEELQKADLGRNDIKSFGVLCHVDLFPVPGEEDADGHQPDTGRRSSIAQLQSAVGSSAMSLNGSLAPGPNHFYSSFSAVTPSSSSYIAATPIPPTSLSHTTFGVPDPTAASLMSSSAFHLSTLPSSTSLPSLQYPLAALHNTVYLCCRLYKLLSIHQRSSIDAPRSDVVAYFGDYPIAESSKCTEALAGATFVQSATLDYKGKKVLMFVFSDLAVKVEGTFILRYRVFNIFSKAFGNHEIPILAECYGGPFKIYSTKEFPGLRASTDLTKHLSFFGVRLNLRENERKRRKKSDMRASEKAADLALAPSSTTTAHSPTVSTSSASTVASASRGRVDKLRKSRGKDWDSDEEENNSSEQREE